MTSYRRNQSEFAVSVSSTQTIYLIPSSRKSTEAAIPNPESQLVLTKGDNNPVDDIALYRGLKYLERKHVVGKVRGYIFTLGVPGLVPFLSPKYPGSCHMWATLPSQWSVSIYPGTLCHTAERTTRRMIIPSSNTH